MAKSKTGSRKIVRVGEYQISTDGVQYIVDVMGLPDATSHLLKGDPNKEISKDRMFYTSFEGLAKGILEKAMKKRFQASGLVGVYNETLKKLIDQCDGLLKKDQ